MDLPLSLEHRPQLKRIRDASLPRRDQDAARRAVQKVLRGQGLEIVEHEGVFAVGAWEDDGHDRETFEPAYEVHPSGVLVPWGDDEGVGWKPVPLAEDDVRARKTSVATKVGEASAGPEPIPALAELTRELSQDEALESAPWHQVEDVTKPLMDALSERGLDAFAAALQGLALDDHLAFLIAEYMGEALGDEPAWVPPASLDKFWIDARSWDADVAWEATFKIAGRAGERLQENLRELVTAKDATFDDMNWATAVLREWGTPEALAILWEAADATVARRRYDLAEVVAVDAAKVVMAQEPDPEQVQDAIERIEGVIRAGVEAGTALREATDLLYDVVALLEPDRVEPALEARGVDPMALYFAVVHGSLGAVEPAIVDLRDGSLQRPRSRAFLNMDEDNEGEGGEPADPAGEVPPEHQWLVQPLTSDDVTTKLKQIVADLPARVRDRVDPLVGTLPQRGAIAEELVGNWPAWKKYHDELYGWEREAFTRVARELLEAFDAHAGG